MNGRAGSILHRSHQIDQPVGARSPDRFPIRPVDGHAVDEHRAQVLNYLSATGCKLGLLVNFGHYPRMEYERLLPRKHEPADLHL